MKDKSRRTRVTELAQELGVSTLHVIEICLEHNIYVLDGGSFLEPPEVTRIKRELQKDLEVSVYCENCGKLKERRLVLHSASWRRVSRLICLDCE